MIWLYQMLMVTSNCRQMATVVNTRHS